MKKLVVTFKPSTLNRIRIAIYCHLDDQKPFRMFSGRSDKSIDQYRCSAVIAEMMLRVMTRYRDADIFKFVGMTDKLNEDIKDILQNKQHSFLTPFERADRDHITAIKSQYKILLDKDEQLT